MPIAVGYIRLSDKDQASNSIASQRRKVEEYCKANKLDLVKVFIDDGKTGWTFDRPGFKEMEAFCRANKKVEYLIIPHFDRFSRADPIDAMTKERYIRDKLGVKILQVTESLDTDTNSPTYQIIRFMQAFAANEERNRIVDRTVTGMRFSLMNGRYCSNAPFGYNNSRDTEGKPLLIIDDERSFIVRQIFKEFLKGTGIEEIKRMARKNGLTLKGKSAIQRILSNPVYAGMVKVPAYKGQPERLVKGVHLPLITESQYYQALDRLSGKNHSSQPREEAFLRGVLYCPCGRKMTAAPSKSKSGKLYWYYFCESHRKTNLSAKKLHDQFFDILDHLTLPPAMLDESRRIMTATLEAYINERGSRFMKTRLALDKILQKIESVEERFLVQPDISPAAYKKTMQPLKAEEARIRTELQSLAQDTQLYWNKLNDLLLSLSDIRATFVRKDLAGKHQLIRTVFEPFLIYTGGTYRTQYFPEIFKGNLLKIKEKGLLEVEQPFEKNTEYFGSPPGGT